MKIFVRAHSRWVVALLLGLLSGCQDPELAAGRKSDALYRDAAAAQAAGDHPKALDLFTQAIEVRPSGYAHLGRAQLYLEMKDEAKAKADIEAGLLLDPEQRDLLWLRDQLKKPAAQRFKGAAAKPPSASK